MFTRRTRTYTVAVLLGLSTACFVTGEKERARFVDGPESSEVAQHTSGYVVVSQGWDAAKPDSARIVAVALPGLTMHVVRRHAPDAWVNAVAGPDARGRIAFIESTPRGVASRHAVRTIALDGTREELVFERSDSAGAIGGRLALSPTGDWVAFVSGGTGRQLPGVYLSVGTLEIWNVVAKGGARTNIAAVDAPMSWSPDGAQLAYVGLDPAHGGSAREAVFVLDRRTGRTRKLWPGTLLGFSPDWHSAIIIPEGSAAWSPVLVDVATGRRRPLVLPAGVRPDDVWLLSDQLALVLADPTAEMKPRWLEFGSFQAGSLMPALKVSDLRTGAFHTIVPYADPRDPVSFGAAARNTAAMNIPAPTSSPAR